MHIKYMFIRQKDSKAIVLQLQFTPQQKDPNSWNQKDLLLKEVNRDDLGKYKLGEEDLNRIREKIGIRAANGEDS